MSHRLRRSRRPSIVLLPALILGLTCACFPDSDREYSGTRVGEDPAGDLDTDWLVAVPAAPRDAVRANDPAVIALDGENADWIAGQSSFISADGQWATYYGQGWGAAYGPNGGPGSESPNAEGEGRSVEQGDVYASLDSETLLNLNVYRGLQVIDVADVEHPRVVSRLPLAGAATELYVVGEHAVVLVNGLQSYTQNTDDLWTSPAEGSLVLVVDLTDRLAPQVVARQRLSGTLAQSRMTRAGGQQALFVATTSVNADYTSETHLRSFSLSARGRLSERAELDVEGPLTVIQATPEAMLLARRDASGEHARVLVVDITDPQGGMWARADVALSGHVSNHTNLDYRAGILRAASAGWTATGTENHLETFAVGETGEATPIDHVRFAPGETLYATLFLARSAFAVTYLRVDPLHAFELDAEGHITERSEFIVSGWNDFFVPVLGQTRMVGVGVDDAAGRQLALSLYDITDLESETPLLERRHVPWAGAATTAQRDHRAFTVLEDAVQVASPQGQIETGLLMLPVSGYDALAGEVQNGTQLFTFSAESLTLRGFVSNRGLVHRGLVVEATTATLSDQELDLFDAVDPDAPAVRGRVALAPNYVDVEEFGEHLARLEDRSWSQAYGAAGGPQPSEVQIIPRDGDPDLTEPVAAFEVPAGAQIVRAGHALVTLVSAYVTSPDGTYRYETDIQVVDLTDPSAPRQRGHLTTDRIEPFYGQGYSDGLTGSYYGEYGYYGDCYSGGCGTRPNVEAYAVGDEAVAFLRRVPRNRLEGTEHYCVSQPRQSSYCPLGSSCTVLTGYVTCRSLNDGPERCTNAIQRCRVSSDGTWNCEALPDAELAGLETNEYCSDYDVFRYWESYELDVLDLSDPERPVLGRTLAMPEDEEDTGVLVVGPDLYVTLKVPVEVAGDDRRFVRYYVRRIGLSDAGAPQLGRPVNVPGEVIRVEDDTLYTRDFVWGGELIEPAVNRLELAGARAFLRARRVFADEEAHRVALDGDGRMLLAHRQAWAVASQEPGFDGARWRPVLTVLDATGDLSVLSEVELDPWMSFVDAYPGRALLLVPGGLMTLDLEVPNAPTARAFLPSSGVPRQPVVAGRTLTFAAGLRGIFRFDLDTRDLLESR